MKYVYAVVAWVIVAAFLGHYRNSLPEVWLWALQALVILLPVLVVRMLVVGRKT